MFMGATGKSAQIPLYVWLPDAMEGPTPVSALIHAATMVTAGIYMVCRSNAIFSRAPIALMVVAIVGCLTAFFAATIGITQTDIKRVLAYSTISQLGYMFLAAGVAAYSAAIFHLMTHAFFKALLFLGAGSVIHAVGGEQDMRKMGGLRKYIPWTFRVMAIATLAISGIPPFAGFVSKDEILWQAVQPGHGHWLFWLLGIITAFMTSFYMFRLLFMTFWGEYRGAPAGDGHGHGGHGDGTPHESPWVMLGPLVLLAVLSIVGGWIGWPQALWGGNHFEHFLEPVMGGSAELAAGTANAVAEHGSRGLELALTGVSILVGFSGLGLAWLLYVSRRDLPERIATSVQGFHTAVLNKYYIDELYGAAVIQPIINFARSVLWRDIDVGVIDRSVNASAEGVREVSDNVRVIYSGNIRSYAGWISAGAAVVVFYMVWVAMR
jgi:NADH-quinone oxidoreductase subunit L